MTDSDRREVWPVNRRELLAATGAGVSGLVAGCSGPLPYVGTVVLNGVWVNNAEEQRHEVRVVVEAGDETHVDRTVVCDPGDGAVLACTWPNEPAQFGVRARHDGEWQRVEFPADAEERCHNVEFTIGGHPGGRDRFDAFVRPCLPEDRTRCGYDGHGWPEDPRPRQ